LFFRFCPGRVGWLGGLFKNRLIRLLKGWRALFFGGLRSRFQNFLLFHQSKLTIKL